MAATKTPTISKMEAVRKALAGLGKDAMPKKIIEFIKKNFAMDMTTGHVSNYKSAILRAKSPKKSEAPKPAAVAPASAPVKAAKPVASAPVVAKVVIAKAPKAVEGGVKLEDIQIVKLLIGRVGEGNLKGLIELLG